MSALIRGSLLSFSPGAESADRLNGFGAKYIEDGVLALRNGRIEFVRPAADFAAAGGSLEQCEDLRPCLVLPGFIDAHVHFPQVDIVASYGAQLLDWLERYAFPAEAAFADSELAEARAERFMELLFANGTTSAVTFATAHPGAAEALFAAAKARGARMIAGKVHADRNVPEALRDGPAGLAESEKLIERWHGNGRLAYAVTPRFAITSTPAQLRAAGELLRRHPGVYLHTHLAENTAEVEQTRRLFPGAKDYTDVYDRFGLVVERSVFAHGIHLSERELECLAGARATVAFCPSSNLFLGSGLMDLKRLRAAGVRCAVGSDVGAGTSLSMLRTLADGYRVCQLQGDSWHPLDALRTATLGNAQALGLDGEIGRLAPGHEADVTVLRAPANGPLRHRLATARTLEERTFAWMMLGDERCVARTYVAGRLAYRNDAATAPAGPSGARA